MVDLIAGLDTETWILIALVAQLGIMIGLCIGLMVADHEWAKHLRKEFPEVLDPLDK